MCQPRRLGGRRCPVHQHQNIAVIKTAGELSGLNRTQTERLFAELRREGRNSRRLSAAQRERSWNSIREAAANTSVAEAVTTELQRATEHDRDLDGASGYAQRLLITRAKERGEALDNRFQEIADRTGYSKTEVKELFSQYADEVDTSRGSTTQSEYYNQNTRNAAVRANLPYDRASVIALGRLNDLAAPETERRVRLIDAPSGSHIKAFGYDEGRLEVQFHSNPDQVYAYQNVPEGLWEHLSTAQRPGSVYARQIRGNSDYMYPSAVEAEQDAYRVRCASCGQFRASIHTCPERETRATLAEAGLTGQEIATVMAEEAANNSAPEVLEEAPADAAAEVDAPVTATPDEEEEPAAEATSTRRTRQPRTPREPAQPVIVTPAPDYEVPTQEFVELTPDSEETIRDSHDILNREGTTFPAIAERPVTISSQLAPEAYDPDALLVSKLTNFQFITVAQDTSYFSTYDSTIRADLGEAVLQEIDNSDSHTRFVIARENAESPFKVLYTYDDRVYTTKTEYEYRGGAYNRSVITRRRGKTDAVKTYTAEEHAALVEAENQKLGALVEAGTAVKIEGNSSETKKYRFDGNLKTQPHMKTGQAAAFKRAIKENKVVIMPVNVRLSDGMDKVVDDQGFSVSARHNTEISGEVAIRRNAEGVMEVISSSRKLKCYCADYRAKYDCQHVRYVQRHIANVAQQMNPVAATRAAGTHPLMTAPLLTRGDVRVVEPENGEPYISFGTSMENVSNAPHNYTYQLQQRLTIPSSLQPADDGHPTTEEVGRMLDYYNMVSSVNSFSTVRGSTDIRRALRRSDVEVPLAATFRGSNTPTGRYETNHVTGSITYEKTDSTSYENLGIRSNTLKCTCDEYRQNYDCPHVRFVKDQSMAVLYVNQRASSVYAEENSYNNFSNRYRTEINNEQQVRNLMTNGRSREEAERLQANEAERLRVEAEERRERQARADAERNAAMAARLQAEAEALRSRNQPVIDATTQYRERMVQRWATQDATYESNPAAFFDDYKAALKRKKDGEHAIPFRTENVTDGICADEPGARQFGIELEFDIKNGVDKRTALRKIGQELHDAGLTPHANQTHYHSAAANGYAMWSFENDCTVDAELVSPLMKDTPEHWEQLRKACEIIERNGGIATTRAGSHVHVSTASYELSTAKHAELLRTVNNNDDIMYRLASNPTRGKHRGTRWCAPNVNDPQGDIDEDVLQSHRVLGSHSSHGYALNFEGTGGVDYQKNNVEFRMWDSTLDPAVIQQQVAVSAAITDYAERSVIENKGSKKGATPRDNIGNGHRAETAVLERAGTKTHTAESFVEANAKVATFFDKLFRRKEDRAAATALFAATTWQRS